MFPWLPICSCFVVEGGGGLAASLSDDEQAGVADAFGTASECLDDILNINNVYVADMACRIIIPFRAPT